MDDQELYDHYAGLAMSSLLIGAPSGTILADVAEEAYLMADEMLIERKLREPKRFLKAMENGWHPWVGGGNCPIPSDTLIEMHRPDSVEAIFGVAKDQDWSKPFSFRKAPDRN